MDILRLIVMVNFQILMAILLVFHYPCVKKIEPLSLAKVKNSQNHIWHCQTILCYWNAELLMCRW